MARIFVPSEVQEDEGRADLDKALCQVQATHLHQQAGENVQARQENARLWQTSALATGKLCRETRCTRSEEHVCEMVGMDGAQSNPTGGLAATATEGRIHECSLAKLDVSK